MTDEVTRDVPATVMTGSVPCLSRTAERGRAVDMVHSVAPWNDGFFLVELIDNLCWSVLRNAYLTDEQARELLAVLWQAPA